MIRKAQPSPSKTKNPHHETGGVNRVPEVYSLISTVPTQQVPRAMHHDEAVGSHVAGADAARRGYYLSHCRSPRPLGSVLESDEEVSGGAEK
jgi:hypothetical protein